MKYNKIMIIICASIVLLGILVMLGWAFGIEILKSIKPSYATMKFNTAFGLTIAGIVFLSLVRNKAREIAFFLTLLLLTLSLSSIVQDLYNVDFGIDELIFKDNESFLSHGNHPGRMAIMTAICLFMLSLSFLFFLWGKYKRIGQCLVHLVSLISFVAIVGYFLNVPIFYRLSILSSMAIHTAIAIFLMTIGLSLLNPELGLARLFLSETVGSRMARKLFPQLLISVLILGYLRIEAHRFGLIDVEFGVALFAISFVLVGLFLIWRTGISLNVSDEKRVLAEEELRQLNFNLETIVDLRNQELKAIFDSAQVAIIATDLRGIVTNFNKGAEKLLGYKAEEVIGKVSPSIFHDTQEVNKRGVELSEQLDREIRGFNVFVERARQGGYESREWTYVHKDGSPFPVQLVVTAIQTSSSINRGYLGIATDISDIKQAKHELEVLSNHLQNRNSQLLNFAHITSHNLRSPVSNLDSLLNFYKDSDDANEKEMLFSKFELVIHHLTATLDELVESLKIQEDDRVVSENVRFDDVFNKTIETLAGQILTTKAKVTSDFSRIVEIQYPKSYVESIFLNLCSNALKYSSPERTPIIHFESTFQSKECILTVSDNGLGIDLVKNGNKIFGLNKTFHNHAESKGVGLFITKTQIESQGGRISVESKQDVGTTFKVIFKKKT